jgi:hypothetical protein
MAKNEFKLIGNQTIDLITQYRYLKLAIAKAINREENAQIKRNAAKFFFIVVEDKKTSLEEKKNELNAIKQLYFAKQP